MTYRYGTDTDPEALAAREALAGFKEASQERRRARILARPEGDEDSTDITEEVVTLLDFISSSMEWGSSMFDGIELDAYKRLAELLKFDQQEPTPLPTNVTLAQAQFLGLRPIQNVTLPEGKD